MSADVTITITLVWREVDPDGSKCARCGEPIYLKQFQPFCKFSNMPEEWAIENVALCQSCKA